MPKYKIEKTLFPSFLKQIRIDEGFTNETIADKLSISKSSYNGYETECTKSIHSDMLENILKVCWEKYKRNNMTDNIAYDDYVCRRVRQMLITYSSDILKEQYWLLALQLRHTFVDFKDIMFKELSEIYADSTLEIILKSLNQNPTIKKLSKYEEVNEIYFKPLTESEKERGVLPIFRIRYSLSDNKIRQMSEDIKNTGKIEVSTLFMLIFNFEIKRHIDEQSAFKETCKKMFLWDVPIIYNQLKLIELPQVEYPRIDENSAMMFKEIRDILISANLSKDDRTMNLFRSNMLTAHIHYLDAIAVDFSFIEGIPDALKTELHLEIRQTIKNFRKNYIHEE